MTTLGCHDNAIPSLPLRNNLEGPLPGQMDGFVVINKLALSVVFAPGNHSFWGLVNRGGELRNVALEGQVDDLNTFIE